MQQEITKIMKPKKFGSLSSIEKLNYLEQVHEFVQKLKPLVPKDEKAIEHMIDNLSKSSSNTVFWVGSSLTVGIPVAIASIAFNSIGVSFPIVAGLMAGTLASLFPFVVLNYGEYPLIHKLAIRLFGGRKLKNLKKSLAEMHAVELKTYPENMAKYKENLAHLNSMVETVTKEFNTGNELEHLSFIDGKFKVFDRKNKNNILIAGKLDQKKEIEDHQEVLIIECDQPEFSKNA